jgi:thiol-disulfide isomerase/thioredoxin
MKTNLLCVALFLVLSVISQAHDIKVTAPKPFKLSYQDITLSQWQETISVYKGNILVVDMWATWCSSCLKRFPHMVEMNKKYTDKNVKFISLLLEDPEEPEAIENAKQFLIKQKADFDHYFMNENIMVSFEKLDLLGIPTVFIYSSEGDLAYRLTGDNPNKQFTELDIEHAINRLLK